MVGIDLGSIDIRVLYKFVMPDLIEQLAIRLSWQTTPAESLVMIRHPAFGLNGFRLGGRNDKVIRDISQACAMFT
jgi:hypothetical protein